MTLYPPLESGESHRFQYVAEIRFRLEKERDFRASMYKKYRRRANFADGLNTALSVTSVGLAASGVGLLSTIIAAPVAIGLQAGDIVCGLLGAGGKLVGRRLQAKARKHDLIRARLVGKYRWREFPVVITGNCRPGKYSQFWQSGKYEILELIRLKDFVKFL